MSTHSTMAIEIPADLPIADRAEELITAITRHQVIVVAGETGSGKSTQLPKLCLLAGRGVDGMIGHTQPRRIAARAVAERVAEELGTRIGERVGYQVRFTDTVSKRSQIKVMTDGILLNELQRDQVLSAYDTIIIDEAHERGLNIDFILGYLAQLLPRRPDLHVIVTSATIDTERFAAHFADADGVPAPVFEVSGRAYPVELRYRPLEDDDGHGNVFERDLTEGIVEAVGELLTQSRTGDILVFASGERDIRDAADALRKAKLAGLEILPLFSRLSSAEQHKVFSAHKTRRVVIATNIAETSLTVPGIRYVVDPGLARISRFNRKTKVQRLPIEKISKASANQRSGRCGRLGPGIAIRLYEEEDFDARSDFTEPEIMRTNLASVILQMTALGLGDVAAFPFVDPPESRAVADGVAVLEELDAVTPAPDQPGGRRLTDSGKRMARIPLDPRLARMILAAEDEGCVQEVMVIASCLSIQDPRERPRDKPQTAEQYHVRFVEPGSDFLTILNLWDHVNATRRELSGNQFRKRCKQEFLHYLRIREWQDVYSQLRRVVKALGIELSHQPDPGEEVHRAMLAGLLGNIGMRDGDSREYLGTRSTRFVIGRRSALSDQPPPWVVAAELVETNRLWAGMATQIRPQWIEPLAGDLVTRTHSEPRWDAARGAATTVERVTFRGLPIVAGRTINLSRVDPAQARYMFLLHALVEGDWDHDYRFQRDNADLVAQVLGLEDRLRRTLAVPSDALLQVYEQRVPGHVVSAAHFVKWWRGAGAQDPDLLQIATADLLVGVDLPDPQNFPDRLEVSGESLDVSYTFDPSRPEVDGVTVDVPVELLPSLDSGDFDWLVPGMRHELVVALIRALPKGLRRGLVPAPQTATAVLARIGPQDGPLLPLLARELTRVGGTPVSVADWRGVRLPDHLRVRYRVIDRGRVLTHGNDLSALRNGFAQHIRQSLTEMTPLTQHSGLTDWTIGTLQKSLTVSRNGLELQTYPSLIDEGGTVGVRALPTRAEQREAMWLGTRRLLRLALSNPARMIDSHLDRSQKLALSQAPHADVSAVLEDCLACVIDAIVVDHGGPAWDAETFTGLRQDVRERAPRLVALTAKVTADIATRSQAVRGRLAEPAPPGLQAGRNDVARHLGRLVYPGFVAATGGARIGRVPRYVQGMLVRLDAMGRSPQRDSDGMSLVHDLEEEHRLLRTLRADQARELTVIRWQLEELRISVFAQSLGTAERVSEARVGKALADVRQRPVARS